MSNKDVTVEAVPLAMPAIDASTWQGCKRDCLARIFVGKGIHEFNRAIGWGKSRMALAGRASGQPLGQAVLAILTRMAIGRHVSRRIASTDNHRAGDVQ